MAALGLIVVQGPAGRGPAVATPVIAEAAAKPVSGVLQPIGEKVATVK